MKRVGIAALMLAAIGAAGYWLFQVRTAARDVPYSGYVDAEYVFVTSTIGGTLTKLGVSRGQAVAAGARLFELDSDAERAARDEAQGRLRQVEALFADLLTGRRPPEIEAIVAQREQAVAAQRQSQADFERQQQLFASGNASKKQLDDARSARDRDQNRVRELDAQLQVARMPGREEAIRAADAAIVAARAALVQAEWRLAQKIGAAPADALVVDTLYRRGEMVAAGLPVVQLLPPDNIKIRFFVPEEAVAQVSLQQKATIACDGCGVPVTATVRYISPRAEFTPPVIYSREQRTRLVFMVEAWPDARPETMRVGQPVDVRMVRP